MLKNTLLFGIILIFVVSISLNASTRKSYGIPSYMKIDFYNKFENSPPDKLFQKVKYHETPSEILKMKPNKIRFLSEDGIEIVNISQNANWSDAQTETWIAINPTNPNNLIATSNDNHYLSGVDGWRMVSFWSKDGGKSWEQEPTNSNDNIIFDVGSRGTIFDPGVSFNTKGEAFYCFGFTMTRYDDNESHRNKNAVLIQKSTTGGESWSPDWNDGLPVSPVAYALNEANNPFHDRYSIAIDQNENSEYKDNIYVSWQRFIVDAAPVVARSSDGGKSWSSPVKLEDHYSTQAPMPAVGPNGEVYVAWIHRISGGRSQAAVARSLDGGKNYSIPIIAQEVYSVGDRDATSGRFTLVDKQSMRVSSPPQIAVDVSDSEYKGTVYVTQAGRDEDGNYSVFVAKSTDKGNSWKKNIRVDNNTLRNDMFFPSISVDPVTGLVAVLYYSSQNDPNNEGVDAYVATSEDGGDTWSQVRVSPYTAYLHNSSTILYQGPGNYYWGDYTSITAYNNHIYPLFWLPSKESNYRYGTNDLFTALLSPNPMGIKDLASENIVDDNVKVKLTWVNPTANQYGGSLDNYTIIISRDGTQIAELEQGLTEYIDEDVVDGQNYRYEVKVKDSKDRYSDSKYIFVDAGGSIIPLKPYDISFSPNANGFELSFAVTDTMIDGTDFRDFEKVEITIPAKDFTTTVTSLNDNNGTVQIDIETEYFYEVFLQTYSKRGGKSNLTYPFVAYAGEVRNDLLENFDNPEDLTPMYVRGGWAITNETSKSEPNSLADSPYEEYEKGLGSSTSSILMAPVKIGNMNSLTFDFIALLANDKAEVNLIDLKGKQHAIKWFGKDISDKFGETLEDSEWETLSLDVSEFNGETVMIQLAIQTNDFQEDLGIYFDNVRLDNSTVSVMDKINNTTVDLSVSPNPATEEVNLNLGVSDAGEINIEMYDLLGNKVMNIDNKFIQPGVHNYNLNVNSLANGSYFVKVFINGKVKTVPIIINK